MTKDPKSSQINLMNLHEKVFYKSAQISMHEQLQHFVYCYKKYNNDANNSKSNLLGSRVNKSASQQEEKQKLIINCTVKIR